MRFLISIAVLVSTAHAGDFTTYVGPGTPNPYAGSTIGALTTDAQGNSYVTGENAFVTKLDPAGNIVFTKTLGQPTYTATDIPSPSIPRATFG